MGSTRRAQVTCVRQAQWESREADARSAGFIKHQEWPWTKGEDRVQEEGLKNRKFRQENMHPQDEMESIMMI